MALWSALAGVVHGKGKRRRAREGARRFRSARPHLEGLETRCLLSYTITDLGSLGGGLSEAMAVNSSGAVAGMSTLASGDQRAVSCINGSLNNLGTLGGTYSTALGINDHNQVVGQSTRSGDAASHAFLYSSGSMHDLGTLGGTNSQANAINLGGQIVGWSNTSGDLSSHAFIYSNGTMTDLGTLGGPNSQADAINNNGQVTGASLDTALNTEAFLYSSGSMTNLGTLGGTYSEGFAINLSGQVVGQSSTSGDANERAFLYSGGTMTSLGTLGGANSKAFAMNDSGTIVGEADVNAYSSDAFIYSGGHMTDLNSLLPAGSGWTLWCATGINNAGQIVGYGIDLQGFEHAFLLSPNTSGASSLSVTGYPSPTTAGTAHSFTVTALDANGNVATDYRGTVHFTSTDTQAVLPANYTFTASDNGVHSFSATLKTAGSKLITATDTVTNSITGSITVTVSPAAASTLRLTGYPSPSTAGTAHNFTVTAKDSYGNVATGYLGTVHFTSTDTQAVLPADYTFAASDHGAHTFSATLKTAGSKSITATDTVTNSITGSRTVNVSPAAASTLRVTGYPSPSTAGTAHNFTVTAKDPYGNVATGYRGTVHFTSTDTQAVLPSDYTFTASDHGAHTFSATLKTAGSESITATDAVTNSITGSRTVLVSPAAAASLQLTGFPSSVTAGTSHSFTVTAFDAYGNVATGYRGTVHFTSSDLLAVLPADYTFTSTDRGVHTFTAILNSVGTQSLTATDTLDGGLVGIELGILVHA
jgi:probable HAF family extracellular repeat protein